VSRARLIVAGAAAVALASALVVATRAAHRSPPPAAVAAAPTPVLAPAAPAPPPPAPPARDDARRYRFGVAAVAGEAAHGQGNARRPLVVGDVVEQSAWIETGKGGSLRLEDPGGARVQVQSSTRLRFDQMDQRGTRLTLDRGRVRDTAGSGRSIGLRAADGDAAVESVGGDFSMQAEDGAVRVVPHRNSVTLIARDERLEVAAGEGAVVTTGHAPVKSRVPRSLLLKVSWPTGLMQRDHRVEVAGHTAPGAVVRAGTSEVVADAAGRFSIAVPLHEGENRPRVVAEDLAGRRVASTGSPVLIDSRRPEISAEAVRYGR